MRRVLRVAWVAVLLAGCSSGAFRPAPGEPSWPPYEGEVEVRRVMPPPGTYVRVGVVFAQGGEFTEHDTLVERLRDEAAAHGADVIVIQRPAKNPALFTRNKPKLAAYALRMKR